MSLCIFSFHAQIIQGNAMKEVSDYFSTANSKTLAIFSLNQRGVPTIALAAHLTEAFGPIQNLKLFQINSLSKIFYFQ